MIPSLQSKNDAQMTNVATLILTAAMVVSLWNPNPWLSVIASVGLGFVLAYLLAVGWFLDACNKENNSRADTMMTFATCCQFAHVLSALAVLVLFASL